MTDSPSFSYAKPEFKLQNKYSIFFIFSYIAPLIAPTKIITQIQIYLQFPSSFVIDMVLTLIMKAHKFDKIVKRSQKFLKRCLYPMNQEISKKINELGRLLPWDTDCDLKGSLQCTLCLRVASSILLVALHQK